MRLLRHSTQICLFLNFFFAFTLEKEFGVILLLFQKKSLELYFLYVNWKKRTQHCVIISYVTFISTNTWENELNLSKWQLDFKNSAKSKLKWGRHWRGRRWLLQKGVESRILKFCCKTAAFIPQGLWREIFLVLSPPSHSPSDAAAFLWTFCCCCCCW